ncbi:MAG TPA: hypothetical protein VIG29_01195, partial [Vicinamibacteria bacterium]
MSKKDETARSADPRKSGPSDDSLQKFLARWAAGEHDPIPPPPEATPSIRSTFAAVRSLMGGSPPSDLNLDEDVADVPKPSGDRPRYQMVARLGEGG